MTVIPFLLLFSCGEKSEDVPVAETEDIPTEESTAPQNTAEIVPIPQTRLLRRISIDIRGKLPTLEEYQSLQDGTKSIEELTTAFLADPGFEESLVYHMADIWLTRVDEFDIVPEDFNLDPAFWWIPLARAVGEEPLRLMAYIASHDQPWTNIVTADHSMANELLGDIFPMEYPEGESGWQPTPYTDGRPAVGILATNGLWWRYPTNSFNMNRTRSAAITKLLLCDDFLERPISFEASENALEDTELALKNDPACIACHSALDPLAASMFGFWWVEQFNPLEAVYYHPERELMAESMMGVSPAWFGTPVSSFAMVGQLIAQDSRFHQCTIRRFQEILLDRTMTLDDHEQSVALTSTFVEENYQVKSLIAHITSLPEYRLENPNEDYPHTRTLRMLSPYQIENTIETLSGYEWGSEEAPLIDDAYRAMLGGVDGRQTFSAQLYPSLSSSLVFKRFSRGQASYLIDQTFSGGESFLPLITFETRPDDPSFTTQLEQLRLVLHGYEADEEWLAETRELWTLLEMEHGAKSAWVALLSAIFQDMDFVSY